MRALLLALPMLLAAPAPAADPVPGFAALRAELEIRRDAEPDPARGRAAGRALSILDRRADSLIARLGVAVRVATLLERAFPEEFPGEPPPASLRALVDAGLQPMLDEIGEDESRLSIRESWLSNRAVGRINRMRDALGRRTDFGPFLSSSADARHLLSRASFLARAHALADRDPGDGVVRTRLTCTFQLEGAEIDFEALDPRLAYFGSERGILLEGTWSIGQGRWTLHLYVPGVGGRSHEVFFPGAGELEGYVLFERPGRLAVRYGILPSGENDLYSVMNFDPFHGFSGSFQLHAADEDGNPLRLRGGYFEISEIEFLP